MASEQLVQDFSHQLYWLVTNDLGLGFVSFSSGGCGKTTVIMAVAAQQPPLKTYFGGWEGDAAQSNKAAKMNQWQNQCTINERAASRHPIPDSSPHKSSTTADGFRLLHLNRTSTTEMQCRNKKYRSNAGAPLTN